MHKSTLVAIAIGMLAIVGMSACSSDTKLSITTSKSQSETTAEDSGSGSTDSSSSGDGSSAVSTPDLSGIPGLSQDCATYISAITSGFTPNAEGVAGLSEAFDKLETQVPDDLKDDVKVLAEGFAKLQKLYEKYNYDYTKIATDPAAATLFSDTKFNEASTNITAWLDKECPSG